LQKKIQVQQNNEQKIKDYSDTLYLIYFDNINIITQQPGESEQDFLNRFTDDSNDANLFNRKI
jgi:hypothetical protein